jgi:xanthine dehydrogenase accessory factor
VARFVRQGLLFAPPGGVPFVATHAALPVVDRVGAAHRVYFSGRDSRGRARVAFFDTDLRAPGRVMGVSRAPVLDLGALGAFDDSGVTTSCLVEEGGRKYLFYTGWSLGVTVPFYLAAGLAVSDDGGLAGSVSGGCVETSVVQVAREVLKGAPPRLLRFGVADETAWAVGLACGGSIEVFVDALDTGVFASLRDAALRDEPLALATVIAGPTALGRKVVLRPGGAVAGSLEGLLDSAATAAVDAALAGGRPARVPTAIGELFVDVLPPLPTLVLVGGVHIAVALVALGRTLGFRTVVVDPRPAFANPERFPHADRIESAWPDEALAALGLTSSTAVAVLTHDPKLDDPALDRALKSGAFYIGALGSRKTHAARLERLKAAGMSDDDLKRIRGPVGLAIGAISPAEIAVSIVGQITQVRRGAAA